MLCMCELGIDCCLHMLFWGCKMHFLHSFFKWFVTVVPGRVYSIWNEMRNLLMIVTVWSKRFPWKWIFQALSALSIFNYDQNLWLTYPKLMMISCVKTLYKTFIVFDCLYVHFIVFSIYTNLTKRLFALK